MRIMGIDYGQRRTGIAVSDEDEILASSVTVITESDPNKTAQKCADYYKALNAKKIVLGLPKNMDATLGFRAQNTIAFADILKGLLPETEIVYLDERLTTKEAEQYMNITNTYGKKRKQTIDALAAKIILQNYLDSK